MRISLSAVCVSVNPAVFIELRHARKKLSTREFWDVNKVTENVSSPILLA
jgi:hypothetical protein